MLQKKHPSGCFFLVVLPYDGLDAVAYVLASVGAFFQLVEDLTPADDGQHVGREVDRLQSSFQIQTVALFFCVVELNDQGLHLLGTLEVFKLAHKDAQKIAGFHQLLCESAAERDVTLSIDMNPLTM